MVITSGCNKKTELDRLWENATELTRPKRNIFVPQYGARPSADRLHQALAEYDKIIEYKIQAGEKKADIYRRLALYGIEEGQWYYAITNYKRALAIEPSKADDYYNIGFCYGRLSVVAVDSAHEEELLDAAEHYYLTAIKLNKKFIRAWYDLGIIARKREEWDKGIQYFAKVVNTETANIKALFGLAACYYGRADRAQGDLAKSYELYNTIVALTEKAYRNSKWQKMFAIAGYTSDQMERWHEQAMENKEKVEQRMYAE